MKLIITFFTSLVFASSVCGQVSDSAWIARVYDHVLTKGVAYEDLRTLCKGIGHRLAGSESAQKAVDWGLLTLLNAGADRVFVMPVEVPHWTRGNVNVASATTSRGDTSLAITALGGSVGTNGPLRAEVIEVKSLEELAELGREKIEGKIVFFNKAMDAALINTGAAYGGAFPIRSKGPSEAARFGAVACIIRSLTLADDNFPHTGATQYEEDVRRIPAAALSAVASRQLSTLLKTDPHLKFTLEMNCEAFPRVMQGNVIGEITGSVYPNEYIVIGGHLDSWDIGEGAHDDGTGIVQSIEVLRCLKAIGYRPQRTIRVVLFINEEFGNDGGITYAKVSMESGWKHLAAIESDGGGFTPLGFNCELTDAQFEHTRPWLAKLEPFNLFKIRQGGSGVDIRPLKDGKVGLFGLSVDGQKYFDYHHTNNDRFENVNRRELHLGAAAMTALTVLLDMHGLE
jgi:carboxypeptidase Q